MATCGCRKRCSGSSVHAVVPTVPVLDMAVESLALELGPHQIWVNALAPGGIATPGCGHMSSAPGVDPQEILQRFLARIPMGRMGEPDEIGQVALLLASEMPSYMTGTQVVVDGGVLLAWVERR